MPRGAEITRDTGQAEDTGNYSHHRCTQTIDYQKKGYTTKKDYSKHNADMQYFLQSGRKTKTESSRIMHHYNNDKKHAPED
eukprot:3153931-Amphidinium_carterae.1